MTLITFQDGKAVMRDGKVGTEQDCCCEGGGNCEDCPLTCCLTIEGRDTCNGGAAVIPGDPLIVESWSGTINEVGATFGFYQYLSDPRDLLVEFNWICADGVISLEVELFEWIPGNVGDGDPPTSQRRWANARATLGPDGCPTGVDLGELTESEGPDPASTPTYGWLCT